MFRYVCIASLALAGTACSGTEPGEEPELPEEITTVTLTFTPTSGNAVVAVWDDADGAGGADPVIDTITLVAGMQYSTAVSFTNKLSTPPEDITAEVAAEADEHQVFFGGAAVDNGLVTHAYEDQDASGLPLGLQNTVTATMAGMGALQVVLRHMPEINDAPQKAAGLAERYQTGGVAELPGETDVSISFELTVEP